MPNSPVFAHTPATLHQLLAQLNQLPHTTQFFVLVDENTSHHCLPIIAHHLPQPYHTITLPSGESNKNINNVQYIWQQFLMQNADRQSIVIILGGGVLGDMSAFAASTYKRGIKFIHIPTTLLAMTDAAIGGKTAINFGDFKNVIGNFTPAYQTIIAPFFLKTLPFVQLLNGFAETIKHALICDKNMFEKLPKNNTFFQTQDINFDWLMPSVQIKQHIVNHDFTEQNQRKLLNYGHTIGHAVESHFLTTTNPLLHGEAIAIGMIIENFLAEHLQILSPNDAHTANNFIASHYRHILRTIHYQNLEKYLLQDKKNQKTNINFSLIASIGSAVYDQFATPQQIQFAITQYNQYVGQMT
jgi:3-dehydroquinate synthase